MAHKDMYVHEHIHIYSIIGYTYTILLGKLNSRICDV